MTITTITTIHSWRDDAIGAALRAESLSGQGVDALLRTIRARQPGWATSFSWGGPLRTRLFAFLEERAGGYRSLLAGSDSYRDGDETFPYFGWYRVNWDGEAVELVLLPSTSSTGPAICLARDEAALRDFGAALQECALRPTGRSLRYSYGWHDAPELDGELGKVGWGDLILAPDTLAAVREAVEGFFGHRAAYAALGFPWRRGILLVGPPGTGKTMICKATAAAAPGLPFLYVRDFHAERGDEPVRTIFERARRLAPCILAFEDIDGLLGDEHRTIFLNELDGFRNNEGLLVIASSNHPGKIDEALLKRPSRFDRVFQIGLPAAAERREFCRRLLALPTLAARRAPDLDGDGLAERASARTEGFTLAYLKEAFTGAVIE